VYKNPEEFYHETDSGAYQLILRLARPACPYGQQWTDYSSTL
jgi:hypothetical protein